MLETEAGPAQVALRGTQLQTGLHKLWDKYPLIGDVRGKGLMQGIELVTDRATKEPAPQAVAQVFEATRRLGLLIGKGGLYGNVLRIAPPLTASEEQVAEALEMLDIAFAQVQENF